MDFFDIIYYFGLALTVLFAKFVFANILPKQAPTYKHAGKKKVCVLGAGVSGLVSAKALLEDDHDVTVFEKANVIGGVWKFPEGKSPISACSTEG
jgi:NADPH-dependent glutamate synthase beta subunit-like oxidoreductase